MPNIIAVYEGGVFRPTCPVDLPEGCTVRIEPLPPANRDYEAHLNGVYEIMARRYDGGEPAIAARHNEHVSPNCDAAAFPLS
jgi:predicted DNA-binding antitoxin AbrB/MazE fold protein